MKERIDSFLGFKQKISKSDVWIVLFCCALVLPFFYSDFAAYYQKKGLVRCLLFALYQYINPLALVYILVYYLLPIFIKNKNIFFFMIVLFVVLNVQALLAVVVLGLIAGQNFAINYDAITFQMQFAILLAAPISMVLFIKQLIEVQNRLLTTEKEKKEAELKLLKQQIDPHFLFNNLNILGALIQQNKDVAAEYLNRFASLYRYIIKHKDEDIVLLEDEWIFAKDYIFLIQQRFGQAYNFEAFKTQPRPVSSQAANDKVCEDKNHGNSIDPALLTSRFVPPGAIQTLIENIIKHNQGDQANPLVIEVNFENDACSIKNEIRTKLTTVESTQTGLKNLEARYRLLSDKKMVIVKLSDSFEVKIPLLKTV